MSGWNLFVRNLNTGALLFRLLRQEMRQLRADFVCDHLPDLAVFDDAALRGVWYVPVRDPFCPDHVAEIRHVHLGNIIELDVRKL